MSGRALWRFRAFRKASQSFSIWTPMPATACHKQKHRGHLLQSPAGHESWLSLGTCLTGMASHPEGTIFHTVARRCGYLRKLRLPFLYSLPANLFRAAASLISTQRAGPVLEAAQVAISGQLTPHCFQIAFF